MEYHYTNFISGLNVSVSPLLLGETELALQDNCITSFKLGTIMKRPGYEQIGSTLQASKSITGLHNFRQSATTQKMLATVNNAGDTATQLFYSTGGAWTAIGAAATAWDTFEDCKVEMEDFIGYCFFVGYDATDNVFLPCRTLTGTTFGTTNTTSMPNAKYIVRYRDKLYVANCFISPTAYPYRVYYSDVPSAGVITWTPATDFLDVDYSEEITGLGENWDRLVIFTEYSAYMYDQSEKKKVWDIGAYHRTIKNYGEYMFFANMDNVWLSTGGYPQAIGGKVRDFVRGADMRTVFAEVVDEEYHLYLGNVTVNGISYANCDLIYDIPTQSWRIHEYYDAMSLLGSFYSAGDDYLWMGTTGGKVMRLGKYTDATLLTSDNTQPIFSWWQTGLLSFGSPHLLKQIPKLIAYSDRAQGLQLKSRIVDRNVIALSKFFPIGQLEKYINEFQVKSDDGNFLQIEGLENGILPYWSYFGHTIFVLPDAQVKP